MAILKYVCGEGVVRDELSSELRYPPGRYTLGSLVGPVLLPSEYDLVLEGVEIMEARRCYRVSVSALVRDVEHFDGIVWISTEDPGPVRIIGEVSDPPFPAVRIALDKAFEPGPGGFWLLRRHTGEARAKLGFVAAQGMRHIFYYDYEVEWRGHPCGETTGGEPQQE